MVSQINTDPFPSFCSDIVCLGRELSLSWLVLSGSLRICHLCTAPPAFFFRLKIAMRPLSKLVPFHLLRVLTDPLSHGVGVPLVYFRLVGPNLSQFYTNTYPLGSGERVPFCICRSCLVPKTLFPFFPLSNAMPFFWSAVHFKSLISTHLKKNLFFLSFLRPEKKLVFLLEINVF